MKKSDIITAVGTVLAEAVIVGVYVRTARKLVKSVEESFDEEVYVKRRRSPC